MFYFLTRVAILIYLYELNVELIEIFTETQQHTIIIKNTTIQYNAFAIIGVVFSFVLLRVIVGIKEYEFRIEIGNIFCNKSNKLRKPNELSNWQSI